MSVCVYVWVCVCWCVFEFSGESADMNVCAREEKDICRNGHTERNGSEVKLRTLN